MTRCVDDTDTAVLLGEMILKQTDTLHQRHSRGGEDVGFGVHQRQRLLDTSPFATGEGFAGAVQHFGFVDTDSAAGESVVHDDRARFDDLDAVNDGAGLLVFTFRGHQLRGPGRIAFELNAVDESWVLGNHQIPGRDESESSW